MSQVRREVTLTPGPIVVRGNISSRNKKKKKFADYVLSWVIGVPIAVVEAKSNNHSVSHGLQQGLGYADLVGFRQIGRSLTGASYAAIPYGPQLNNYKDLIDPIKVSDENESEPLSDEELQILKQVAGKFPKEQIVYDAAHREKNMEGDCNGCFDSILSCP